MENKVILITGATSGLGAAAAKVFAAMSGKVVFCGRRLEEGHRIEAAIRSKGGEATFVQADVTSEKQVEQDFFKNVRPSSLIQRFITVEEVANLVVYTCSEQASATTGTALRVDGGVVRSIA